LGAFDEQLELTHGSPADVKNGPGGSQKDRSNNQKQPQVHDSKKIRLL